MPNSDRLGVQQLCRHVPILTLEQKRTERQALARGTQAGLPQQFSCPASIRILMFSRCRVRHGSEEIAPNCYMVLAPGTAIASTTQTPALAGGQSSEWGKGDFEIIGTDRLG
jgi:hypothetical protein